MARRRKTAAAGTTPSRSSRFHTPFARLRKLARRITSAPSTGKAASAVATAARDGSEEDDSAYLEEAMRGVVPLAPGDRQRVDRPAPAGDRVRRPVSDDAEALAALADLVSGTGSFDISDTDEYVEGRVAGLDPRIIRRMRKGDFAYQDHLDLHQLTVDEARLAVERFLSEAYHLGRRCVLIVHGRGHNSKDQVPVLKERLKVWLGRGALSRFVLAFTTARGCDGGAGALYVLLRRERRRRVPFVVTDGAKR